MSTEKIVVFNKKDKKRGAIWKWGNKELEKAKVFKCLGFTFNNKGNYTDHIKELSRKGKIAANRV